MVVLAAFEFLLTKQNFSPQLNRFTSRSTSTPSAVESTYSYLLNKVIKYRGKPVSLYFIGKQEFLMSCTFTHLSYTTRASPMTERWQWNVRLTATGADFSKSLPLLFLSLLFSILHFFSLFPFLSRFLIHYSLLSAFFFVSFHCPLFTIHKYCLILLAQKFFRNRTSVKEGRPRSYWRWGDAPSADG